MLLLSLMLNTLVCSRQVSNLPTIDYKSIALPAELQGHGLFCRINRLISQLNQYEINSLSCSHAPHARSLVIRCRSIVSNLSVYESVWNPISYGISKWCLTSLKQIKSWSGKHYEKIYQIYKTKS